MLSRQELTKILVRSEIFKHVLPIHGHIIECGVRKGEGLMTWANLSAMHEPFNHTRRCVGLDTWSGFPSVHEVDKSGGHPMAETGGMNDGDYDALVEEIKAYDSNRPIGHIPRVKLVKGDACQTIPRYVEDNPHLMVALLHLDFDIYEPTKTALKHFVPLMPKGAVIVFDELCCEKWPGETKALDETIGIRNLRLQRFSFASTVSWAIIE